MPVKKKLISKKQMEVIVQEQIPISNSVKELEAKFEWLKDIHWNSTKDEND